MTARVLHLRHERKFLVEDRDLAGVLALVRRHPALFRETYLARRVNNLYLDSAGLGDYHDHVNGLADRQKTRVRWYGIARGRVERPVLEQKFKRGLVSGKRTYPLPPLSLDGEPGHDLDSLFDRAGLPAPLRLALGLLQPVVANRYHRHYFQSADGRIRLTIDTDLEFPPVSGLDGANSGSPLPAIILELKFDPDAGDLAAAVTNALPFRLARCSKYVLGIERRCGR